MRLSQRIAAFWESDPVGIVLEPSQVDALALKAVTFYLGYAHLEWMRETEVQPEDADPDTCLTEGEWAVIRPLFDLYVERQNAMELESTRQLGLDVYGRQVSEIQGDINAYEMELPHKAFYQGAVTV